MYSNPLKLVSHKIKSYPCLQSLKSCHTFINLNYGLAERVTTHYQTLKTWIGLNVTRYHNLSALPHALPYIFSDICLVLGYWLRVTTRYRHFLLKNVNVFFINLTVSRGNTLQIAPNHAKLSENVWYRVW